jgi:hypothetical protein
MKIAALLIALCLGPGPALGETVEPPAKPAPPKPRVVDLDFTADDDASESWPREAPAPRTSAVPVARPAASQAASKQWIYWAAGATAVAAGGLGWFWYHETGEPRVIRNEQFFNDERP